MKNRNNRNSGFTMMELLIGVALVVIIAFFGMRIMASVNPDGWETVEVAQVLKGEEGSFALTADGVAIPIASKEIASSIHPGENRLQISKNEATGLRTITGFKTNEGVETVAPVTAQDQKKKA